jgi:CubicO group peptidase (beta-lactamase class C family)
MRRWRLTLTVAGSLFALLCGVAIARCHAQLTEATGGPTVTAQQLAALIESARGDWNVPGLAVAVVKDGEVVLVQGFGVREHGTTEPVDADTLFAIASNTKAFTSAAIAILQSEGRLQWDDRVQQYLPWLQLYDPWVSAEIRVEDLLCHRSGLGTFSGDLLWWGTPYSAEDVLRRARHLPAKHPFRAEYGYSNLMFLAAGEVIQSASGQPWSTFIRERILQPAEMSRTVTSVTELAALGNAATPHKTLAAGNQPIPWVNWDTMAAAGGIISSASDMARWIRIQLDEGRIDDNRRLFPAAASRKMWTGHTVMPISETGRRRSPTTHFRACGLGWMLSDYRGRLTVSHGGGYDGMYSHVLLVPDDRLGIVVLTNSMTGIASPLATTIADRFLHGDSTTDWLAEGLTQDRANRAAFLKRIDDAVQPVPGAAPNARPLDDYAGAWECPLYGRIDVTREGDGLVLAMRPNPDLVADLKPLHFDTWKIDWRNEFAWFGAGTVQFVPDASGRFQELRFNVPNDDLWFDELHPQRITESSMP